MSVEIHIVDGPLGPAESRERGVQEGVGAALMFDGVVRAMEGDRMVVALAYEAYEPMAGRVLRELGESIARKHGLSRLSVWHSRGRVPVGMVSFRLIVEAAHRAEALAAADAFIDAMKRDVPIWKSVAE